VTKDTILIKLSIAAFVWTIGWSIWQYTRMRRPSIIVTASRYLMNYEDGLERVAPDFQPRMFDISVTAGERRPIAIRWCAIDRPLWCPRPAWPRRS